jgi:pimeloyl-ACP methyl ester carboxylesterase
MSASATSTTTATTTRLAGAASVVTDRPGLVVAGSIASGLALGLVLVLGAFAGADEASIVGSALFALGAGFAVLGLASSRLMTQPQRWAFAPGVATGLAGLLAIGLSPGDRALALCGWVWPPLLLVLVAWSIRGARRSLDHWSRRALLYPSLVVLLLVAAGGAVSTVSAAISTEGGPGRAYLVDGHSLYLHCVGTGAPTVVLFNGLGERTPSWAWVQQSVAATTRVCAFDRAGEGWSGGATARRDGRQLASDLHELLRVARVPGPYVLAGHSVGGVYALVYAARYPREVAGVALVDSATPHQFDLPAYPGFYAMGRRLYSVMPSFARVGLARLMADAQFAALPDDARRQARAFASSPRELRADHAEFAELPTVFDQAKALQSLGSDPLAVVTAGAGMQAGWSEAQRKLARLSRNSVHQTVVGATHAALLEDRGFAWFTSHAITHVVESARSGRR